MRKHWVDLIVFVLTIALAGACGPRVKPHDTRSAEQPAAGDVAQPGVDQPSADAVPGGEKGESQADGPRKRDPNDPVAAFWGVSDAWEYVAALRQVTGLTFNEVAAAGINNNNRDSAAAAVALEKAGLPLFTGIDQLPTTAGPSTLKVAYAFCNEALSNNNRGRFLPGYNFPNLDSETEQERYASLLVKAFLQLDAGDGAYAPLVAGLKNGLAAVVAANTVGNANTNARVAGCAALATSAGFMLR
jgi:hypothetical protein